jgi:hypothetical protein
MHVEVTQQHVQDRANGLRKIERRTEKLADLIEGNQLEISIAGRTATRSGRLFSFRLSVERAIHAFVQCNNRANREDPGTCREMLDEFIRSPDLVPDSGLQRETTVGRNTTDAMSFRAPSQPRGEARNYKRDG